jgi:hypothetical protein
MKLIDTIRRKIIDFRCRVSEREIDAYIYNGGGKKFLSKVLSEPYGEVRAKPDRVKIRQFLSSRKRRTLFNGKLDKYLPNDFRIKDGKPYHVEAKPSKYTDFKEAYWSEESPLNIAKRIIISAKSLLLKTVEPRKMTKKEVAAKNYDSFADGYKDIVSSTDKYAMGTYPSAKPLEQMNKALQSDKKASKKLKQGAQQVISAIEDFNKPIQTKKQRSNKTTRRRK